MTEKRLPLTDLPVGQVPPDVLVCGDPDRVTKAGAFLDQATLLSDKREYRCYSGRYRAMPVAVCSHGIGAPGAAIAFEELIAAGARRIIRTGSCGGLQPGMKPGDLVIARAAVQNTGYGQETVPLGYPAVADPELVLALRSAAREQGREPAEGIVLTHDNFYRGVDLATSPDYQTMSLANVLAVEMECAALFIVASLRRVRAAAILAVDGNVLASGAEDMASYAPSAGAVQRAIETEIQIALEALHSG